MLDADRSMWTGPFAHSITYGEQVFTDVGIRNLADFIVSFSCEALSEIQ